MMNRKGLLGLDTIKGVIVALLLLAILAICMFLVIVPMRDAVEKVDYNTGSVVNETVYPNWTGFALSKSTLRNVVCSITKISNASTANTINSGNYTLVSNPCSVRNTTSEYPASANSAWNVSYSYTYNKADTYNLVENMTTSPQNFFSYSGTFFTLLGVVVIILIIALVIVAAMRFNLGGEGGRSSNLEEI